MNQIQNTSIAIIATEIRENGKTNEIMKQLQNTVNFYGTELITIQKNGQIFVSMKQIAELIGLDWSAQVQRIKRSTVLNSVMVTLTTTGSDGKKYEMVSLPIEYLNGWLFGVNENKVKPEIKDKLIQYQKECYTVLAKHFLPVGLVEQLQSELRQKERYLEREQKEVYILENEVACLQREYKQEISRLRKNEPSEIELYGLITRFCSEMKISTKFAWVVIWSELEKTNDIDSKKLKKQYGSDINAIVQSRLIKKAYDCFNKYIGDQTWKPRFYEGLK